MYPTLGRWEATPGLAAWPPSFCRVPWGRLQCPPTPGSTAYILYLGLFMPLEAAAWTWNRFLGPKSAFFKGSLNTHTLINAALSLLAQKQSCSALSVQSIAAAKPFPLSVPLTQFVHHVPASQEKMSISICKTSLSNPHQPLLASLAYLTLGQDSTSSPRSITWTSMAS